MIVRPASIRPARPGATRPATVIEMPGRPGSFTGWGPTL